MASVPGEDDRLFARIDAAGRLVEADPVLAGFQEQAGSSIGGRLALPQLAAIARLVRKLGVSIARPAIVAGRDHDLELWVRGDVEGDDVILWVDNWKRRAVAGPRLDSVASGDEFSAIPGARDDWATDAELRVTSVSADLASLAGITPDQAIGEPLTRLLRLEEGDKGAMPLLMALAGRSSFSGQMAVTRGATAHRLVLSGEPIIEADRFDGFRGRIVAEGRALPAAANESARPGFTIDPALDQALRSPLDRIVAAAEGIVERSEGPLRTDYAEYAGDIAAAAKHLLSVIRSMAEEKSDESDVIDLAALCQEAVGMVEAQAEERSVTLVADDGGPLHAHGDTRSVVQILVNLLGNAVRHSPDGGTVRIAFGEHAGMVQVSVADEGPGIALADQERIFDKFERLGSEAASGSGLGLAIARRLARSMNGEITLVSAPGQGARFTLSLPAA